MSTDKQDQVAADPPETVPTPQGHVAGMPYDLRRPTVSRVKSRAWNPSEPRFFPPKAFGAGWGVNFYWLFHLVAYFKQRGTASA